MNGPYFASLPPESFYGSARNFCVTKSPVHSSLSYLLKHGVPRHPDVVDR